MRKVVLIVLVALVQSAIAFAEVGGVPHEGAPETYDQAVKERYYPGGRDEQPLTVQESLPNPHSPVDLRQLHAEVLEEVLKEQESQRNEEETNGEVKEREDNRVD